MNRFDTAISEYLLENKTVSLDKIGTITITAYNAEQVESLPVTFTCDKKISTSPELIDFIAEKERKNKKLIASDLESHLSQVREYINIGKSYEIPGTGFIKANKTGTYVFLPYSDVNKPLRSATQQVKQKTSGGNRSIIQLITFLIVIAILAGLGYLAYQFFVKNKTTNTNDTVVNNTADTSANNIITDTAKNDTLIDSTAAKPVSYSANDTVSVRYIFETTASLLRAQTRTDQLRGFGNVTGYDSTTSNQTKLYSLYILKPTKIADTLAIKDSLAKFLQKDIKLQIEPKQ